MNNASICTTRTASAWKVTNYGNGRVGTCVWWLNEWPQHVLCRIFVGMGLHRSSSVRHGWSRVCHQHIVLSKWRHKNLRRNYSGFEPICHICSFTPFLSLLSLIAIDPSSPPPLSSFSAESISLPVLQRFFSRFASFPHTDVTLFTQVQSRHAGNKKKHINCK